MLLAAIVSAALMQLFARCASAVGPVTMSAIVVYESGARPYAIGDNTARRSYVFGDRANASAFAARLLRAGHSIDLGYAQINSANFAAYGLDAQSALDPCTNVATGSAILQRAYAGAVRLYGRGQPALAHALSVYNSGGYFAGLDYARGVYATAGTLRYERDPVWSARRAGVRAVRFVAARARSIVREAR